MYVKQFMDHCDGSRDFKHIQRILRLALNIALSKPKTYDLHVITLLALLHDVGDKKYLKPGDNPKTMVHDVLRNFGADETLVCKVQKICSGVAYSSEITDFAYVQTLLVEHPELGPVQDSDRLDPIGTAGHWESFHIRGCTWWETVERDYGDLHAEAGEFGGIDEDGEGEKVREFARERTERLKIFRSGGRKNIMLVSSLDVETFSAKNIILLAAFHSRDHHATDKRLLTVDNASELRLMFLFGGHS